MTTMASASTTGGDLTASEWVQNSITNHAQWKSGFVSGKHRALHKGEWKDDAAVFAIISDELQPNWANEWARESITHSTVRVENEPCDKWAVHWSYVTFCAGPHAAYNVCQELAVGGRRVVPVAFTPHFAMSADATVSALRALAANHAAFPRTSDATYSQRVLNIFSGWYRFAWDTYRLLGEVGFRLVFSLMDANPKMAINDAVEVAVALVETRTVAKN